MHTSERWTASEGDLSRIRSSSDVLGEDGRGVREEWKAIVVYAMMDRNRAGFGSVCEQLQNGYGAVLRRVCSNLENG